MTAMPGGFKLLAIAPHMEEPIAQAYPLPRLLAVC